MKTETRKLSDLYHDPANARLHGEANLEAIRNSLKRFGQQEVIVINADGMVVAGNGRLTVARELGWETMEVVVTDLSPIDIAAFGIASNRTAELATWDAPALAAVLSALADEEGAVEAAGFDADALTAALAAANAAPATDEDGNPIDPSIPVDATGAPLPPAVEDEAPDPLAAAGTRVGDLWGLSGDAGEHRILCGDATVAADVERVMDGELAGLFLTDPPYNVAYVGKTEDALTIQNDSMGDGDFFAFLVHAFTHAASVLRPGASFYIWHADIEGLNFRAAVKATSLSLRQCLVWVKNALVMGRQDYHWRHEPCLYGWKEGHAHAWHTDRKQTTTLFFDKPSRSEEHPKSIRR